MDHELEFNEPEIEQTARAGRRRQRPYERVGVAAEPGAHERLPGAV